jgi:hypothetical protein
VNPATIDRDHLMNKALDNPIIVIDILENIYQYRINTGRMDELKGTRLYGFFTSPQFQKLQNHKKATSQIKASDPFTFKSF